MYFKNMKIQIKKSDKGKKCLYAEFINLHNMPEEYWGIKRIISSQYMQNLKSKEFLFWVKLLANIEDLLIRIYHKV